MGLKYIILHFGCRACQVIIWIRRNQIVIFRQSDRLSIEEETTNPRLIDLYHVESKKFLIGIVVVVDGHLGSPVQHDKSGASMERQQSFSRKKMAKQYTSKRDDSPLHAAVRSGDLVLALEILNDCRDDEDGLKELISRQNQSGETALYVAAENGHVELVGELMRYYDVGSAGIKARNGYDAFHVAAKRGDLGMFSREIQVSPSLFSLFLFHVSVCPEFISSTSSLRENDLLCELLFLGFSAIFLCVSGKTKHFWHGSLTSRGSHVF